jgi:hypothetical protein
MKGVCVSLVEDTELEGCSLQLYTGPYCQGFVNEAYYKNTFC